MARETCTSKAGRPRARDPHHQPHDARTTSPTAVQPRQPRTLHLTRGPAQVRGPAALKLGGAGVVLPQRGKDDHILGVLDPRRAAVQRPRRYPVGSYAAGVDEREHLASLGLVWASAPLESQLVDRLGAT